jgi:hypothetical protein
MNELFNKLKIEEFNCFFYTVCTLFNCIIYHELISAKEDYTSYQNKSEIYDLSIITLLIVNSVTCLLFSN